MLLLRCSTQSTGDQREVLSRGAASGEGLGNNFLSHIAAVDGILHVCRAFEDPDVIHTEDRIDPVEDLDIIHRCASAVMEPTQHCGSNELPHSSRVLLLLLLYSTQWCHKACLNPTCSNIGKSRLHVPAQRLAAPVRALPAATG